MVEESICPQIQDRVLGRVAKEADGVEGLDVVAALDALVVFFGAVVDGEHAGDAFVELGRGFAAAAAGSNRA